MCKIIIICKYKKAHPKNDNHRLKSVGVVEASVPFFYQIKL